MRVTLICISMLFECFPFSYIERGTIIDPFLTKLAKHLIDEKFTCTGCDRFPAQQKKVARKRYKIR